ncbi:hypothetical protein DQ239_13670 [Blastococcus sp. TF02-09]|uniref:hypothetical protein n=1 Tax=Blastococcus sp. TF02-09 TaxID=2250576 RepID=UPI000DEBB8D0|nr:hypothetical protein [Blastococcus sp. TF02-9]RBY76586.1 hypothetical protein DQ239_13670 [Blastococcus sp. TF02-9]
MSTPGNEPPAEQVATPTVSTAPTGGTAEAPHTSWWHWKRLPDHLGRARTSTVILSVLFLAVFTLYLNVRPEDGLTDTTPAGGSSGVQTPTNPVIPTDPTTTSPEPTEEPTPTTEPEETEETEESGTPSEETDTPTTSSTPSTSSSSAPETTTEPSVPTETSEPASPTSGTTGTSPSTSG